MVTNKNQRSDSESINPYLNFSNCILFAANPRIIGTVLLAYNAPAQDKHFKRSEAIDLLPVAYVIPLKTYCNEFVEVVKQKAPTLECDPAELESYLLEQTSEEAFHRANSFFVKILNYGIKCGLPFSEQINETALTDFRTILENRNEFERSPNDFFKKYCHPENIASSKAVKKAASGGALCVFNLLKEIVPQLTYQFLSEKKSLNSYPTLINSCISGCSTLVHLSPEQRENLVNKIISSSGCTLYFYDHNAIIKAATENRIAPLRTICSLACRAFNAMNADFEFDSASSEDFIRYNNIEPFFQMLRESEMTVREMAEFAEAGILYHFGFTAPSEYFQKVILAFEKDGIADLNAIEALRQQMIEEVEKKDKSKLSKLSEPEKENYASGLFRRCGVETDEAVIQYIQVSNSKINEQLTKKV